MLGRGMPRSGLAGAPGRPGRGAPKMSAPGRGAGRCQSRQEGSISLLRLDRPPAAIERDAANEQGSGQ